MPVDMLRSHSPESVRVERPSTTLGTNGEGETGTNGEGEIARSLLAWYDANARALPWRAPPRAARADPYRVWLSEIMLQQTTVAAVTPYFERFTARWPHVAALAAADDEDVMSAWAGLGYYARARNLLACARAIMAEHDGRFPRDEAALLRLPGVGRYTAAAIVAIAFGKRAVVVDGNVERVIARLFAVATPLPAAKPELYRLAATLTPERRAGDHAQALMDLAASICTPRAPKCPICPLFVSCRGLSDAFPVRLPKRVRPYRHGVAFWLQRQGKVLLVRRPAAGLLGGMRALPSGPWQADPPGLIDAPVCGDWTVTGSVAHVFTHFALDLAVARLRLEKGCAPQLAGEWWPIDRLDEAGLPTVFAKAARLAREESE